MIDQGRRLPGTLATKLKMAALLATAVGRVSSRSRLTCCPSGKAAASRHHKSLEDFDWSFNPSLPKKLIFDLTGGRFIREHRDGAARPVLPWLRFAVLRQRGVPSARASRSLTTSATARWISATRRPLTTRAAEVLRLRLRGEEPGRKLADRRTVRPKSCLPLPSIRHPQTVWYTPRGVAVAGFLSSGRTGKFGHVPTGKYLVRAGHELRRIARIGSLHSGGGMVAAAVRAFRACRKFVAGDPSQGYEPRSPPRDFSNT